jgi:hypothetical protein
MKRLVSLLAVVVLFAPVALSQARAPDQPAEEGIQMVSPMVPVGQTARYTVSYFRSDTNSAIRSATVVTVTNQFSGNCNVSVEFFKGFAPTSPVCTLNLTLGPGVTADYCSRGIPDGLTTCNATCSPASTFDEGKARVNSTTNTTTIFCGKLAVSSRTYYTAGTLDDTLLSITDNKIVKVAAGNNGD